MKNKIKRVVLGEGGLWFTGGVASEGVWVCYGIEDGSKLKPLSKAAEKLCLENKRVRLIAEVIE
jgi:hypothetical protein